ncbi:MAG TPA: radical SAM protein [Candidatus Aminicenantes bacterium]|nr:MAG: hypothetical protein C0168_11250 [Candidatus Aminicenantes bacterium]HEK85657.1 radical SAM protein [Candidatus Aminicenantes bacterium]
MKPRVLLIQPPLEDFYTTPIRLYPLGLLYVAAILKKFGIEVKILDTLNPLKKRKIPWPKKFSYLHPYLGRPYFFKHYQRFGLPMEKILKKIEEFSPELIGISSAFAAYYSQVEELIKTIRKYFDIPIIIGGNQATAASDDIKARCPEIEEIIPGQAEVSLPVYLARKFKSFFPSGLHNSEDRGVVDWRYLKPAHELLNPSSYQIGRKNYISLQASRGCPHRCSFCNIHLIFGRKIEYRPIGSILEEMTWNYLQRQVRIFNFEDDNLAFDREWFREFVMAIEKNELLKKAELTFMNGLSYENLDDEILWLMKRAGVKKLDLSWVSGDQAIRHRYQRPPKKDEADFFPLIKQAKRLGFFVTVYLILGLPGQSKEEIISTTEKLLDHQVLVGPSVFYLTPGSELYEELNLPDSIREDWDRYRSTAFAVETDQLKQQDLIDLFIYIRKRNLERLSAKD